MGNAGDVLTPPTRTSLRRSAAQAPAPASLQADAITNAVRPAAEHGDHVTSDQFKVGLAEVRTEIAALDTRISTQVAGLRTEMRTEIAGLRTEIALVRGSSPTGTEPHIEHPS